MNFLTILRVLFIAGCLMLHAYVASAQDYQISYLSVEDGLSHNEVTSIIQDDEGFMWFGTRGGLNRYDGYQFKHYKPGREQTSSIQDASVECLFRDSNGHLWIGTQSGGYSYYDLVNEQFVVPPGSAKFNKSPVISFDEDDKGNICISSIGKGIIKYKADSNKFEELVSEGFCRTVTCVNDTLLFWGTQSGLGNMLSGKVEKTIKFKTGYQDPMKIIVDRHHPYVWIVGWRLDLIRYDYASGIVKTFVIPDSQSNLEAGISMMQDEGGDLWIGTKGKGLYKFHVRDSAFRKIEIKPEGTASANLDYDVVLDIFQDKAGDIWLGTDGGGIVRLSKEKQFLTYDKRTAIVGLHITAVLEDRDGVLWVGTKGQGLFMRDEHGQFTNIYGSNTKDSNTFESGYVRTIYQSEDGLIWVGFESTLFVVQNNMDGSSELVNAANYFKSPGLNIRKPLSLVKIGKQLWIATEETGLYLFEKEKDRIVLQNRFQGAEKEGHITSYWGLVLNYDDQKRLWVGTKEGLYLYQADDNSFTSVKSLISNQTFPFDNTILCLHTDKSGHVWFGTPSSLNQLIEEPNGSFKLMEYTKKDGLPDDYVNTVLSDEKGNIWLSTNAGLSTYNKQNRTFRNYDVSDGFGGLNFSKLSGCVGLNGQLYFGGFNSLTYFNASEIIENSYAPPVVVTEFKILNRPYMVNAKGILKKSINSPQRINLSHKQNEFSIEFAALDYKAPQLHQYAYWLEGRDSSRVLLGNRRYISFSNLKPGDYTLHLYGTNSNGIWSAQEKTINLSISPAPWKTWYAAGFYIFLIVLIVFIIIKVVIKQEQLNRNIELEKLLREKQKQVNEDKLRFFTNISHEIRTPLTLILAPFNELLQKDFSKLGYGFIKDRVELVHQNASKLLELVNQLLEFRKLEAEKVQLQASESDFVEFIRQLCEPFETYAASKSIRFKAEYKLKEASLYFDNEKMSVVINNLLSNAFKFAGQPGKVSVKVEACDDAHVLLSISNNGKGIPSSNMEFLFERFHHGANQSAMDSFGIGLSLVKGYVELHKGEIDVKSTPGELTTFTLKFLKGTKHLLADEITISPTQLEYYEGAIDKKQTEPEIKPKKASRGATVLIVEDNEELRTYLKELLEMYFKVIVAKDGLEGFDSVIENKPQLVVSDVMMPRMDGFELCHKIKTNTLVAHTPVILLTAKGTTKDEVFGTRQGADAYLKKPFDTNLLLEKINMLIESRRKLLDKYADKVVLDPKNIEIESSDAIFIKNVMAEIESNIGNVSFTKEQLAGKMSMSYSSFNRKCKDTTDLTPSALIKSVRLKRAAQLLRDSDLTVMEIMDSIAYLEIKNFRRNFIKEYKMTLSEYRKINRQ